MDDTLLIRKINSENIKKIFTIYNNTSEFKYATGFFSNPLDFGLFSQQINNFLLIDNVFFLNICLLKSGDSIGLIKGSVIEEKQILWINSLAIDTPYQANGYGKRAFILIESFFKERCKTKKIFLSVYKENYTGIKFWHKCGFKLCDYTSQYDSEKINEHIQIMCKIV